MRLDEIRSANRQAGFKSFFEFDADSISRYGRTFQRMLLRQTPHWLDMIRITDRPGVPSYSECEDVLNVRSKIGAQTGTFKA